MRIFLSDCFEVVSTVAYVVGLTYAALWAAGNVGESICAVGYAMCDALVVLRAEM